MLNWIGRKVGLRSLGSWGILRGGREGILNLGSWGRCCLSAIWGFFFLSWRLAAPRARFTDFNWGGKKPLLGFLGFNRAGLGDFIFSNFGFFIKASSPGLMRCWNLGAGAPALGLAALAGAATPRRRLMPKGSASAEAAAGKPERR